jgi:hypothetical protein
MTEINHKKWGLLKNQVLPTWMGAKFGTGRKRALLEFSSFPIL